MTDQPREQQQQSDLTAGEREAAKGLHDEITDHSLALMSQESVRGRILAAMDDVLDLGFGCDLLARPLRGGTELRLRVMRDSNSERPVRTLQAIGDRHRLDFLVSSEVGNTVELIFYPRA